MKQHITKHWNLFLISLYFVLGKDFLRFVESYYSISFPLNLISFSLVIICILPCLYELKSVNLNPYNLVALFIIVFDYVTISINFFFSFEFNLREITGITYIHLLIPIYVILTSNKINYYKIFFGDKKFFPIIFIVFSVGIIQLLWFKFFPQESFQMLSLFFNNGWIYWPFQVSATGIYARPMSIFYSSFAFGLFTIFLIAVLIFSSLQLKKKLFLITLLVLVLFFIGNRNCYLAFFVILIFKISSIQISNRQKSMRFMTLLFILLGITNLFMPFAMKELPVSHFSNDNNPFTKTTTMGSRIKAWGEITNSLDQNFIFGYGVVQGLKNTTTLADNFLIYKIQQNGFVSLVFWILYFCILSFAVIKMLLKGHPKSHLAGSLLGSFFVMSNFNNLFYEPVFQCLFMGTLFGLINHKQIGNSFLCSKNL